MRITRCVQVAFLLGGLVLAACLESAAQDTPTGRNTASRLAVGTRGMISSAHPLATQAGLEVLEAGGNALACLCHAAITAAEAGRAGPKDVVLSCGFEDAPWWRAWGLKGEPANTALVDGKAAFGGQGKSLKVTIPRGTNTGANFHFRFRQHGSEPEGIYFRYYLKLDPDWKKASDGGKLPGISATYGKAGWGGRKVDGTDGWSARGHFKRPGPDATEVGYYCYHADMKGKYGDVFTFNPPLQYDRWYCIEMYCKLNTLGKEGVRGSKDGILRAWIDGKPAFERTNLRFRDTAKLKIESIWVNVYHGGTRPAPEDLHLYLDNLVIAHKPIGPVKGKSDTQRKSSGGAGDG